MPVNVFVTVNDASGDSCLVTLSGGSGSCSLTLHMAGAKVLTGTYSGDGNFNGSADTESHQVDKADTSTSLSSSANPSKFGQSVTFTATVSVTSPGSGTATGTSCATLFRSGISLLSRCATLAVSSAS